MDEVTRKKISDATKGVKKTITKPNPGWFKKGFTPWIKGKKGFIPWNKGRLTGNGRFSRKYIRWKMLVLERDANKCTKCGSTKNLHVHHTVAWKDSEQLRFELNNGVTLCRACHSRTEGKLEKCRCVEKIYRKGHRPSDETRRKMSETHKRYCATHGSSLKGYKFTDEQRKRLSLAHLGQKAWNKGLRKEEEKIRKCKVCGIEKNIDEFTPNGNGHTRMCKKCRNLGLKVKRDQESQRA